MTRVIRSTVALCLVAVAARAVSRAAGAAGTACAAMAHTATNSRQTADNNERMATWMRVGHRDEPAVRCRKRRSGCLPRARGFVRTAINKERTIERIEQIWRKEL